MESLTATQLKNLYYKATHGDSVSEAGRSEGISTGNAAQAVHTIKRYIGWILDGKIKKKKRLRKTYVLAAQWAIEQDKIKITKPEPVEIKEDTADDQGANERVVLPPPDPYTKLNLHFGIFSDAVYKFIEEMVAIKSAPIIAENKALKEILGEAKIGNWADGLKKRLEGNL